MLREFWFFTESWGKSSLGRVCERADAADGMADFLRHFLRCEHLRLHAEALLEAVVVDFAFPRRDNQNRLLLALKRERFRDAPRPTAQRLCRQSNRCAGFIEFTDAVGNPLRGKCCAYLFD